MSGFWLFLLKTDPSFHMVRKVQFRLVLAPSMMGIHFACYGLITSKSADVWEGIE